MRIWRSWWIRTAALWRGSISAFDWIAQGLLRGDISVRFDGVGQRPDHNDSCKFVLLHQFANFFCEIFLPAVAQSAPELQNRNIATDIQLAGQSQSSSFDLGRQISHRRLQEISLKEGYSLEAIEHDEVVEGVGGDVSCWDGIEQ